MKRSYCRACDLVFLQVFHCKFKEVAAEKSVLRSPVDLLQMHPYAMLLRHL